MILDQKFSFELNTQEVVFLQAFFKQGLNKLGNGTFRDEIQKLKDRFDRQLLESEIEDRDKRLKDGIY